MDALDTRQLHLMQPQSGERLVAYERWYAFYDRLEEYDRTVCTGPSLQGMAMPANNVEYVKIQKHRSELFRLVDMDLQRLKVPDGVSHEMRNAAHRDWLLKRAG